MIRAIVYTSNTGSTAAYAKLLGEQINLPVFPLPQAKDRVPSGSEIIYLGWIMAGGVKGYKAAGKRYQIRAVCAVGMAAEKQHSQRYDAFYTPRRIGAQKAPRNIWLYDQCDV